MKEYTIFHGGGAEESKRRLHHRKFSSLNAVSALQEAIFTCLFGRFHDISRAPLIVTARSVS